MVKVPNLAYLFLDFAKHRADERSDIAERIKSGLPNHELKVVNFFSSLVDDLLIVSKHRVVSLPTFVVLDDKKKPRVRTLKIPSDQTLAAIAAVDGN